MAGRRLSRLPASRIDADPHKTDGFAVGVSKPHYWVITALAHAKNQPRTQIMEEILNHYIACVLPNTKE
jgi:hypothetical protein